MGDRLDVALGQAPPEVRDERPVLLIEHPDHLRIKLHAQETIANVLESHALAPQDARDTELGMAPPNLPVPAHESDVQMRSV